VILGNLLLALAWAALHGEFTLQGLMIGAILGRLVLVVLARGGVLPSREIGRVERALLLFGYLCRQIVIANVRMTRDVLSIRPRFTPGVIRLPLDVTTDGEILLLAAMINVTPGSVALDVSPDRRIMYVHVMNMPNPEVAKREIKEGFERRILGLRAPNEEKVNET
jgi:multicomponent Na+:H+ antiporter subunit E